MTEQREHHNTFAPESIRELITTLENMPVADAHPEQFPPDAEGEVVRQEGLRLEQIRAKTKGTPTEDMEILSWCPGGSASGGVCSPSNNTRYNWMERYSGCHALPIGECVLLGAHNAGFDKDAPRPYSMQTCQDVDIDEQLSWGVRVLDLRVEHFSGSSGASRFSIVHDSTNGRTVEDDVLGDLSKFRQDHNAYKEIVILDFHEFRNFTAAAHAEFRELLTRKLGSSVVPYSCKDAAVAQLWALGMNTVVAYSHSDRGPFFWPGVNQRWIGENTPSKDKMGDFIRDVGSEEKPFGELKSVQAAYYSLPLFTPKDLSEDLMGWFASTDTGGEISGHYIITTDWCLRQRLADNVIHANDVRRRMRNAHIVSTNSSRNNAEVQTNSYGIYWIYDGQHTWNITLAPNRTSYTSIVLIHSDAEYESTLIWEGGNLVIKKGARLLFRIPGGERAQLLWHTSGLMESE